MIDSVTDFEMAIANAILMHTKEVDAPKCRDRAAARYSYEPLNSGREASRMEAEGNEGEEAPQEAGEEAPQEAEDEAEDESQRKETQRARGRAA